MRLMAAGILGVCALMGPAEPAMGNETVTQAQLDEATVGDHWIYRNYSQSVDGEDRNRETDYEYEGSMTYTAPVGQPGALFTCSERHGLGAALSVRAIDFDEALDLQDRRARWRSVTATFGDDEAITDRWMQLPRVGTVEPESKAIRAKIYNAAIAGETVTLKIAGRPDIRIEFPPVDENFTRWAMECPATRPS